MNADAQRRLHLWATIAWAGITIPACLLIVLFREHEAAAIWTLVWLTFVSHYANIVGHWSAWQAVKVEVEVQQDDQSKE